MKIGLAGFVLGAALAWVAVENATPGSTEPAADSTRTAANNLAVTLGGMVSDLGHVAIPVASDLVDTARSEFPNVLGPAVPADGAGTAQHPPTQPQD